MRKKKRSYVLKIVFFISIICITSILVGEEKKNDMPVADVQKDSIPAEENKVNETSSFPSNVYGVPVYTDLIDINEDTRPRD